MSTEAFKLERPHDGPVQPRPKVRPGEHTEANRARRDRRKERREAAWGQRKLDAGWSPERVTLGLWARADRQERARLKQVDRQADHDAWQGPVLPAPRSDSPLSIVGRDALMLTVQSLPQVRIKLDRPIPPGAEVTQVHLQKAYGHDARVEVRLVLRVPFKRPTWDPLATGAAIHAAVKHLPEDASDLAFVEAVRKAGIPVIGEDSNITAPSATSDGRTTKPVTRKRGDVARLKELNRISSGQQAAWMKAHTPPPIVMPADFIGPVKQKRPPRYVPGKRARKVFSRAAKIHRTWRNASETRAHQDAKLLVAGNLLVAIDPHRMVSPLLAKGGPVDRRTVRERLGLPADVPVPDPSLPPWMTPAKRRKMRSNLHVTRIGLRIDRTAELCRLTGAIHAMSGHEGTSRQCPNCPSHRPKGIDERVHSCTACGLVMPRDQASATVTVGRSLRAFRCSPDPGGRIAEAERDRIEALAKAEKLRQRRSGSGRKRSKTGIPAATAAENQGVVCPGRLGAEHQAVVSSAVNGQGTQTETRLTAL